MSNPIKNPLTLYLNRAEMNRIYRILVLLPLLPRCNERLRKRVDKFLQNRSTRLSRVVVVASDHRSGE